MHTLTKIFEAGCAVAAALILVVVFHHFELVTLSDMALRVCAVGLFLQLFLAGVYLATAPDRVEEGME